MMQTYARTVRILLRGSTNCEAVKCGTNDTRSIYITVGWCGKRITINHIHKASIRVDSRTSQMELKTIQVKKKQQSFRLTGPCLLWIWIQVRCILPASYEFEFPQALRPTIAKKPFVLPQKNVPPSSTSKKEKPRMLVEEQVQKNR